MKTDSTNRSIYAMFLSAVEESLTITLANICNAIRIGHLTWLVPTEVQGDAYFADASDARTATHSILTLRAQVTAFGVLLLLPEVNATNLVTLSGLDPELEKETMASFGPESTLLIAPSGITAYLADDISALSLNNQQPEEAKTGRQTRKEARSRLARQAKDDAWKLSVTKRLASLSAIPSDHKKPEQWTRVNVCNPKQSDPAVKPIASGLRTLWPNTLCFKSLPIPRALITRPSDMDWPNSKLYEDPLNSAETWLCGKKARDEEAASAQQNLVPVEEDKGMSDPLPQEVTADQISLASPVYSRGLDQTSMNGIYPTPPDGLLPGTSAEQTVLSTITAEGMASHDVTEEAPPVRRPSNSSSQGGFDADEFRKQDTDELFGDMDEEMFGAPDADGDVDVTDADFSFFDDGGAPDLLKLRKESSQPEAKVSENNVFAESAPPSVQPDISETEETTNGLVNAGGSRQDHPAEQLVADTVAVAEPGHAEETLHTTAVENPTKEEAGETLSPIHEDQAKSEEHNITSTPPLSPFQIKEKILPSPIPASSSRNHDDNHESRHSRRDSNFQPVAFKTDISSFDAKYSILGRFNSHAMYSKDDSRHARSSVVPVKLDRSHSIALPPKANETRKHRLQLRKTSAPSRPQTDIRTLDGTSSEELDSSSEDEASIDHSDNDSISSQAAGFTRKRKRDLHDDAVPAYISKGLADLSAESDVESTMSDESSVADPNLALDLLLPRNPQKDQQSTAQDAPHKFSEKSLPWRSSKDNSTSSVYTESLWDIFDFAGSDMISVAQIVAENLSELEQFSADGGTNEQGVSSDRSQFDSDGITTMTYSTAQDAVQSVFSLATECDFTKLAMIISTHADKTAREQNQPRPAVRRPNGPSVTGGHLFTMPAPSVHLQRAGSSWDMLPSAVNFWESLGLEPASGPKDLSVYMIYPENNGLEGATLGFLDNVKQAYENCKFGMHHRGSTYSEEVPDGLVPFQMSGEFTARSFIQSLHAACIAFGDALRDSEPKQMDRPILVYLINPFDDPAMAKYICACFWTFCRAYTDALDPTEDSIPDFALQIVPMERIAPRNTVAVLDAEWLSSLARRVYDSIPTRSHLLEPGSQWLIPTWPSIQLAQPQPRKIHFVLHEKPPRSLLEEAQILHVAYTISNDNAWLAAAWSDPTGKYQYSACYYLRETDSKSVLSEVRDVTLGMARTGPWRIFVGRVGTLREWEKQVWKEHPSDHWAITLLDVDINPTLRITSTPDPVRASTLFMTPASTPQSAINTVSPAADTPALSTDGTPQQQQPSQPDPSTATSTAPADPDAYLVDPSDESWGLVLPFSAIHTPSCTTLASRALASGVLLKRGIPSSPSLPSLGVDVVDMLAPRVGEGQSNWLMPRAPDAVLREVLNWYRGLGLLGRLRGVRGSGEGVVPVHVLAVLNAVDSLAGFME